MTLLADRFLRVPDAWFDISTGERVLVLVRAAGPLTEQIAWAEKCAMLSRLRHPLINPLIDYGVADSSSLFEAYLDRAPVDVCGITATRLVIDASRFLEAHGIAVGASDAPIVFRKARLSRRGARGRPVGIVLQPRRALDLLSEMLTAGLRGGSTTIALAAAPAAGLRTALTIVSHRARMEGYAPVCTVALARWPALVDLLERRHVCLLTGMDDQAAGRAAGARLLTRLAAASARPHIVLNVRRAHRPPAGALHLEPMGTTAMASMVYADPELGPSAAELFEAARGSGGLPGLFVAQLGARAFERSPAAVWTVHESPVAYNTDGIAASAESTRTGTSRLGAVLLRARRRAAALHASGRHAAAHRLLVRAARALEGRGESAEAARCRLQLAWMARDRGATAAAVAHAKEAARTDPTAEGSAAAELVIAVCRTDEDRLVEAEASLRNLSAATAIVGNERLRTRCLVALARVLCWQGRAAEALELIAGLEHAAEPGACEALLVRAKAMLLTGDVRGSLLAARTAANHARGVEQSRLLAAAHRVIADALRAAGDLEGMRQQVHAGLEAATAAHLPLAALKLRAVLVHGLQTMDPGAVDTVRMRACLERALRRDLPPLLRRVLEAACGAAARPVPQRATSFASSGELERFLDIAQRASDDAGAVQAVVGALCDRVEAASAAVLAGEGGRILSYAGRPWRDEPAAGLRALASGLPVGAGDRPPAEIGEPVRCGGELVGAIACRWLVGVAPPPHAAEVTRAAGVAIATHVRALLESRLPEPPPVAWGDLLGDSPAANALRESIVRAARAPFPVLIEGESGSGKELVARAIHRLSPRHTRRFCAINCAALTDELVEAELFGHTRGAFTGAATDRAGLFEEADGGTLFLDEVGELSPRAQAKLLRVIQEGEVRRVGENLPRRVDVRVISATNRRLAADAEGGRFRTDLRFRLDVLRISVPPLRERVADIPVLAQHFWRQACARVGSQATLGPDALAALARCDWPGNVRELQNAIAWMAVHAPRRGRVGAAHLPAQAAAAGPLATGSFEAAREEFERRYIRAALAQAGGHRQAAARALGVSRQGLAKMLRRLGIEQDAGG